MDDFIYSVEDIKNFLLTKGYSWNGEFIRHESMLPGLELRRTRSLMYPIDRKYYLEIDNLTFNLYGKVEGRSNNLHDNLYLAKEYSLYWIQYLVKTHPGEIRKMKEDILRKKNQVIKSNAEKVMLLQSQIDQIQGEIQKINKDDEDLFNCLSNIENSIENKTPFENIEEQDPFQLQ